MPCRSVFRRISRLITTRIAVRRQLGASHDPLAPSYQVTVGLYAADTWPAAGLFSALEHGYLHNSRAPWLEHPWSIIMAKVLAADFKIITLLISNRMSHSQFDFTVSTCLLDFKHWNKLETVYIFMLSTSQIKTLCAELSFRPQTS